MHFILNEVNFQKDVFVHVIQLPTIQSIHRLNNTYLLNAVKQPSMIFVFLNT